MRLASLINYNGASKFPPSNFYYSRYDTYLRSAGVSLLSPNTGCTNMYPHFFNSAVSPTVLAPGCTVTPTPTASILTDVTTCSNSITYMGSVNVPVYTPTCFEPPSSLSHFEDMCQVPMGFTTACTVTPPGSNNNLYYVMSNANGTGDCYVKRFLKPEERSVLCDLGYSVSTTYGGTAANSSFTYAGAACPGMSIAGINDGLTGGSAYTYITSTGTTFSITGILSNDFNATTYECVQDLNATGTTIINVNGNATTPIIFTSSVAGCHVLRYVPISPTGQRGNITYIYVFVNDANCTTSCATQNMVNNSGFEGGLGCGQLDISNNTVDCWYWYRGTPDIHASGCFPPVTPAMTTYTSSSARILGMFGGSSTDEAAQTQLNAPLVPFQNYVLSFWARTMNSPAFPEVNCSILFYSFPNVIPGNGATGYSFPISNIIPDAFELKQTLVPRDLTWHYYSVPFTFNGLFPHNALGIINNSSQYGYNQNYIYIDDVTIKPANQLVTLNLPSVTCNTTTIADLSTFLSPPTPGGVFSGPGVGLSGGVYSFTPSVAGLGTHNIIYTYSVSGCPTTIAASITVSNGSSFTVSANATPTAICLSNTTTLTATGATTYTWNPGTLTGTSVTVSPISTTIYTVTGSVCSNTVQSNVTVSVTASASPTLSITPSFTICLGDNPTLTVSGASTYSWSTGATTNTVTVYPSVTTPYSVIGTSTAGCVATATSIVTVAQRPSLTITASLFPICSGQSSTLTASGATAANSKAPVSIAIEQKQQRANELILKYMNDRNYVFTDNEKMDLKNMANECVVKGDYVTHARNLVDIFTRTIILYDDECEAEANASRKKKITDDVVNRTFNLYPNPNNGIMTLDYDLGNNSEATIKLFDVTGKLISTYNLQNTKGSIGMNEQNLTNGIYFYSILVKEKVIKNDKIVIIR